MKINSKEYYWHTSREVRLQHSTLIRWKVSKDQTYDYQANMRRSSPVNGYNSNQQDKTDA